MEETPSDLCAIYCTGTTRTPYFDATICYALRVWCGARIVMRASISVFPVLAVAGLLAVSPAEAFQVSGSAGLNVGSTTQLTDPDVPVEHVANGNGPEGSASWSDRTIAATPSAPLNGALSNDAARWSLSWY